MSAQKLIGQAGDADGAWLYRMGGISALLIGTAYIVTIALYVPVGAPPSQGEAWLQYLAGKTAIWWAILGLSVLTDVLFIPVALALYRALEPINRSAMLVACTLIGLFVALDLAVTWPNHVALITLSGQYAAAADAQRAADVVAATYASAVLASSLESVYSILILSVAILMIGLAMRKGIFGRGAAYLGVVTGILGIVAALGPLVARALSITIITVSLLTTLWVFVIGYRLYRLGQR
jgi:hypothetical protein